MANLKVFIVDDEYLIRNLLKMRIRWQELGMEIAGEASGAKEALELIESIIPDIIFTDICMPFMDGIEFSRIVIEKFPHIKIVIITGHDEFEYAKRSIKLGISDFLLKPINEEEIRKVAGDLKIKIEAERTHIKEYEKLKQRLEDSMPYLREKSLNELLREDFNLDTISEKLSYFKIDIHTEYDVYQVAVVEVSRAIKETDEGEEDRILLKIRCADVIHQMLREDSYVQVFFDGVGRIVLLSNNEGLELTDCCETIKTLIINRCKCFVSIGIGNTVKGLKNIKISYLEACDASNYKVVVGKNQVVNYNDITFGNDHPWRSSSGKRDKLDFYIKAGVNEKTAQLIDELFAEYSYSRANTIEKVRLEAFDILSVCLHVLLELNIATSTLWDYHTKPYEELSRIDNLPELKDYLKSLVSSIIDRVYRLNEKRANSMILKIQEYICKNLHDPELSLSSVAKEFYISSSHLSRLFKQETAQTFVEYITKMRMEGALKLLKETDMKGYQIAEKVGIPDPHYFSIIFKKFTGLSVNEFRKS